MTVEVNADDPTPVATAEEFEEQFGKKGYLSEIMSGVFPCNVRIAHADWFALVGDTNEALQAIAVKSVDRYSGPLGDKRVLATLLLLRCLGLFQGAVLLLERGMVVEARVVMRSLLETSFCLGAIHEDADAFVERFRSDHRKSQRQQAEAAIQFGELDPASEQFKALTEAIEAISTSEKLLNMTEIAKSGPLSRMFVLYKMMSNDSSHCSVTSVLNHYDRDSQAKGGAGYILGPFGADQVVPNIDNLILIATGIGVGFTNIVGDPEANRRISALCERYEVLRKAAS